MHETKQPLTPRAFLEMKVPHSPNVSPDGTRVVFCANEADFEESRWISRLWLAEILEGNARRITHSYEGERSPKWSPDGKWIAFLSARPDMTEPPPEQEDEEDLHKEQIWILPAGGGEADRLAKVKEGVRGFEWAPDSQTIIYLAPEARPQPIQSVRDAERKRKVDPVIEHKEKLRHQFWEVDLQEKKPNLLYTGDYGVAEFDISPDGKRVVFNSNQTGEPNDYYQFDLSVLDLESESDPVRLVERAGGKFQPQWSPDGSQIAFIANLDPNLSYSQECVWQVSAEGGEACNLFKGLPYDVHTIQWSRDGRLLALAADGTNGRLVVVTDDGVSGVMPGADVIDCTDFHTGPSGALAVVMEDDRNPPELYSVNVDGSRTALTELNKDFVERYELPRQEVIRWQSPDGTEIEGVLTYPCSPPNLPKTGGTIGNSGAHRSDKSGSSDVSVMSDPANRVARQPAGSAAGGSPTDTESGSAPLVVQVHGGPKGRSTNSLRSYCMHPVWAAEGYLVLRPNFRGSEGYGNDFAIANRRDLGGGDFRDVMAGVDYLVERGLADPNRMGIMGGSYGGYMTNWAISQTNRFAAAVSMFGIFHLITDYSNSEISRWDADYMGAYYWEDPEIYRRCSPATYLASVKTPVLIIHGESDSNTFIANSREMYQALRQRGVTLEFVHYPREPHGLREPNHKMDEMRRALAWMDRYLNGGAQRIRRVEEKLEHDGYEFVVSRAEDAEYAGWHEEWGRLMELAFSVASKDPVDSAWQFRLDEVRLVDSGGSDCELKGVPVDAGGARTLVTGEGLVVDVHPDPDTGRLSLGLAAAFLIPKEGGLFTLHVADFPAVTVSVGRKEEKTEPEAAEGAPPSEPLPSTPPDEGPPTAPQRPGIRRARSA